MWPSMLLLLALLGVVGSDIVVKLERQKTVETFACSCSGIAYSHIGSQPSLGRGGGLQLNLYNKQVLAHELNS